ncbi:S-layer homology domain-containing protein [Bacillus sp. FJAT-29790]|uniref:S-layer homology domain-containing protein n=1 Tax=Bacillus sp. FJAT-29790 TaxID=1895002 RepID=UPI001C2206A4|nr:S-layer homology domain-containing protein [Bacillus sp. FJAT-29790]MBU8881159.1 S-layer homology domain-containing protein [Bacillus sp. FJAT-29790]
MLKKGIILLFCSALLTACSAVEEKLSAGSPLEAASAEWVEDEAGKLASKMDSLDERIKKIEAALGDGSTVVPAPSGPDLAFNDVTENYWAYKEIMALSALNIIKGYPEQQRFFPERSITRYQAASMIVKALDLPLSDSPSIFADVPPTHPGLAEMMTVYEHGIFKGSEGQFLPGEPMKRRHMAMVLQRAFQFKETNKAVDDYKDVSRTIEGYEEIKTISQYGVATGNDGYFKPEEPTKRSHFSAFIFRALPFKNN